MRREFFYGAVINSAFLFMNGGILPRPPEFVLGVLFGFGLSLMIVGVLPDAVYNSIMGKKIDFSKR